MSRRPRWLIGVTVALAGLGLWAIGIEPGRVAVRSSEIILPGWPPPLAGIRIAVLGDIHTGAPHVSPDKLRAIVGEVNAAAPDVVVLLGDYVIHGVVGGSFVEPEVTAGILGGLRAPGGIVAVLGNHDWWYDGFRVRRALEARGIIVLENEVHRVPRDGGSFWLAGLADLWTREPDIPGTLSGTPAGAPVLLLTHSPDVFPEVPARVAVTLAAHTHGGQVRIPPSSLPWRGARGFAVAASFLFSTSCTRRSSARSKMTPGSPFAISREGRHVARSPAPFFRRPC